MDEVYLLWLLSISMLIGSFLSGMVPMAFRLSDNKSRLLALLGSGILVGTALSIIIPEGIDALYGQSTQPFPLIPATQHKPEHETSSDHSHVAIDKKNQDQINSLDIEQSNSNRSDRSSNQSMTWTIGSSLIVGFVLMLLIDQFSIYQGNGHHHSTAEQIQITGRSQTNYTLACQDDDTDIGLEEDEKAIIRSETSSETKPIKDVDTHKIMMRSPDSLNGIGDDSNVASLNPNHYYDHSRSITQHKVRGTKVTPTLGLVIHAAADGIALGAAATTAHKDIEMIIFLAIMLHKAPAAFSLVVLLLHNGLRPQTIRRHLMAFSLSAPIAAVVTYFGLSQSGKEVLRRNNATGIAMLFSAGTFLFVATVHVLPDLIQNKLLTPREMCFLLGGAFLPLLLAQTV